MTNYINDEPPLISRIDGLDAGMEHQTRMELARELEADPVRISDRLVQEELYYNK